MTFASGRYSKRKRTQVNYRMEEMDVDEVDSESEEEMVKPKVRRLLYKHASDTDPTSEAAQDCSIWAAAKAEDLPFPPTTCGDPEHDL